MKKSIFIIGCGSVGVSLGKALKDSGLDIVGVADIDLERAQKAALLLDSKVFSCDSNATLQEADFVLLAATDHQIESIAQQAVFNGACSPEQIWLHCSGRLEIQILSVLGDRVLGWGSMHPALVFPPGQISHIPPGTCFAVDGSRPAKSKITALVKSLGGVVIDIPPEKRAVYHAAMVMGSNYIVGLLSEAKRLLASAGVDDLNIETLLITLSQSALKAASEQGLKNSLSGPIRRGDTQAVKDHLKALENDKRAQDLYATMGKVTAEIVAKMPDTDKETIKSILKLL